MPEETTTATSEASSSLADILGPPEPIGSQGTTPEAGEVEKPGVSQTNVAVAEPEQVMQFMQSVDRFAESRVRPEVAKVFLDDFLTAMWGDKGHKLASTASPEAAKQFTKTMTKFGYLFLNDALPEILNQYVPQML